MEGFMKIRVSYLILLAAGVLTLSACSKSDSVPAVPKSPFSPGNGGGEKEAEAETMLQGLWTSTCQEDDVQNFKSYMIEYNFASPDLSVDAHYFAEEGCVDEQEVIEFNGTFEASQPLKEGNNMVTFTEEGGDVFYFRTMQINDGTFIVTKFKNSLNAASEAVAEIVLQRPEGAE